MKGISNVLSHTIYLLLGLTTLILILITLSTLRTDIERNSITSQLSYSIEFVKDEILSLNNIAENSDDPSAEIEITLPEKIGNKKYTIELYQKGLKIYLNDIEVNRKINIDADLEGRSDLPAFLKLERINGVNKISVIAK
ncbi:MAG: hypothetical protein ACE5J4_01975 [Candidatus Aenigmatarchaeota archaeon]